MNRHRILLAVSTSRYSRHLVEHAISEAEHAREAGADASIDVLFVIEDEELQRAARQAGEAGFLGLDPQREVLETLGAEHHRMALERVREAEEAARAAGIPVRSRTVHGRFADAVLAAAGEIDADVIVLTRADRPFISRILFGSEADRVARIARRKGLCDVVIDEGDAD